MTVPFSGVLAIVRAAMPIRRPIVALFFFSIPIDPVFIVLPCSISTRHDYNSTREKSHRISVGENDYWWLDLCHVYKQDVDATSNNNFHAEIT